MKLVKFTNKPVNEILWSWIVLKDRFWVKEKHSTSDRKNVNKMKFCYVLHAQKRNQCIKQWHNLAYSNGWYASLGARGSLLMLTENKIKCVHAKKGTRFIHWLIDLID